MTSITFPSRVVSQETFKEKIGEGISGLIRDRFGNKPEAAIRHYDRDGNGLDEGELAQMVRDAGYQGGQRVAGGPGNAFNKKVSPEFVAEEMIAEMDSNGNDRVSLQEFVSGREPPRAALSTPTGRAIGVSLRRPPV